MPHYDETEVTRLVREAFEEDEPASESNHEATECGSYASLALLMTEAGSSFTSALHVAHCTTCQRMLARLLAHRCPNTRVLKEYRKPESNFASIAALGWHIVGCNWCRLRLVFIPPVAIDSLPRSAWRETGLVPAPLNTTLPSRPRGMFHRYPLAIAYSVALLAVIGCVWLGLSWRRERRVAAGRELQWTEATNRAESRVQELTRQLQALNPRQSATAQTPDNSAKETRLAEGRPKSEPPRTIPLVATFTLGIGSERGDSGLNEFSIPARVARVRLKIPLSKNDYKKYRVTLKKPEGEQLFVRDAVPIATGKQLVIESPVGVLSDGDYILTVTGVDSNGETKADVDNYSIRFTHVP